MYEKTCSSVWNIQKIPKFVTNYIFIMKINLNNLDKHQQTLFSQKAWSLLLLFLFLDNSFTGILGDKLSCRMQDVCLCLFPCALPLCLLSEYLEMSFLWLRLLLPWCLHLKTNEIENARLNKSFFFQMFFSWVLVIIMKEMTDILSFLLLQSSALELWFWGNFEEHVVWGWLSLGVRVNTKWGL